jgi:hypothetical protein
VIAVLLVIGLVGDDEEPTEQARTEPTTDTAPTTETREEQPPRPRRVSLRIIPNNEIYVCVDKGLGTEIAFEGIITEPQTFRGRRVRVNLGKTDVQLTKNGRPVELEPGPDPVGFAFTPGSTRSLPSGERPCA